MAISLPGLATGIDTSSIVSQLMAINQQPVIRLQQQKAAALTEQAAVEDIQRLLTQLQTLAGGISGTSKLAGVAAASSDPNVIGVTAATGATEGTHSVIVNRMATAAREVQAGIVQKETWANNHAVASADAEYISAADISDSAGANYKLNFQFGSESAVSVDLSEYDATGVTLNQLVAKINVAAGYTAAAAVEDGGQFKLQLRAKAAGADKALTITDSSSVDLLDAAADFTKTKAGVAGVDTLVGAGQFVYTHDGVTRTIQTTATTTLGNLQDLINKDSANPGVTASILEYPADDDHVFHLVLGGTRSGSDYGITIEAATTLAGFGPGGGSWTPTQQAQDSQIRVDGYPAATWIERSSNTITDVIPGATIALRKVSETPVTVTLNRDTGSLVNNIQNLVAIHNTLETTISKYCDYDTKNKKSGLLQGDSTVNRILNQVRSVLTSRPAGFADGVQAYTTPADLGIEIDKTGQLKLDSEKLTKALSDNYQAVLNVIGVIGAGESSSPSVQLTNAEAATAGGTYEVETDFNVGTGAITAGRVRVKGETAWRTFGISGSTLTGQTGSAEAGLQLTVAWDGHSATQAAEITVRQGFATVLDNVLDGILDSTDGVLAGRKKSFDSLTKTIDNNIELMQDRLDDQQARLKAQYARLETSLTQLTGQMSAFNALFTMTSNSDSD